jgi:excisionase family DNA binding protein
MVLDNLQDVLTIKQLAESLQVSDQTIKKAIRVGRLEAFKVGRDWRIEKSAVLNWIERGK